MTEKTEVAKEEGAALTPEKTLELVMRIANGAFGYGVASGDAMSHDLAMAMAASSERRLDLAVRWVVRHSSWASELFAGLPSVDGATYQFQMPLAARRIADLAIFHADGSATVVEMKDGDQGFERVRAAIGQVGLYAFLMGQSRVRGAEIRRAVMWCGLSDEDCAAMKAICRDAGVVPIAVHGDLAQTCMDEHTNTMVAATITAIKEKAG